MKVNFYFLIPLSIFISETIVSHLEAKKIGENIIKKNGQIQELGIICVMLSLVGIFVGCVWGGDLLKYMLLFSTPFFGVGLLILLAYQSWMIVYDKQGFRFRSWCFKNYYYMYSEIKRIERYGTKVTLHMEDRDIKMDTDEMKGCTFFLRRISEDKKERRGDLDE